MRFMNIVKSCHESEDGQPPSPALMAAIGKMAEEVTKAGIMLENGGLLPSALGATIRAKGGKLTVKDGPFTEAKELIGGYAIMQVRSKEEAIELGRRFLQVHIDVMGPAYEAELEIRQMVEDADIPHAH